jgi:hypothetical protein
VEVRLTHIGGPTVLIEVGGWRLLADPTFDPPGQSSASFGRAPSSRSTNGGGSTFEKETGGRPGIAEAPEDIRERIRWLPLGVPTELTA